MSLLLAIDAGTTGVTTLLYSSDLTVVRRAYREFPQGFPQPGWVEHDADDIRSAVAQSLEELLQGVAEPIAGIGITNQRETVFALERKDGQALGPGIVWQDRRTKERCDAMRAAGLGDSIRQRTGLLLDPYFSGSKIQWMLENRPGLREKAEAGEVVFATVDALVLQTLCGGDHWFTDPTNACRTMLFHLGTNQWEGSLCAEFGVKVDWLPQVIPSRGHFGSARLPGYRTAPVLGIAGDQQAALFGQGCIEPGDIKTTYGTGCFLMMNTGTERVDPEGGLLTTLALGRGGTTCFAIEGSVFVGGAVIQWLRDGLGILGDADESEELAGQVTDSGGVVLVPAFAGLGAPHWDAEARGAILGLTRGSGRGHIVRAALESIALQCGDIITLLRKGSDLEIPEMRVDGGATRNDLLMQIQADVSGLRVLRGHDVESTGRGAAALAGLGAGLWDCHTKASRGEELTEFEPAMAPEEVKALWERWQAALDRIKSR